MAQQGSSLPVACAQSAIGAGRTGAGEQRGLVLTSSRKPLGLPLFYMRMQ